MLMSMGLSPRPAGHLRIAIQDYADRADRPALRVTDVPVPWMIKIDEGQMGRWRRLFKRLMRRLRGAVFPAMIATALLARMFLHEHGLGEQHFPLAVGAITSAIAISFKAEQWTGTHNFTITTGNTIKCALYTSSATLGASTTAYSATNEISGTGYTATGVTMANVTPTTSGTTAIADWADASWTSSSFTANGCLVYNSSASNKAVFVIAFGSDQTVTSGTFTIQWPTADASNAILRAA